MTFPSFRERGLAAVGPGTGFPRWRCRMRPAATRFPRSVLARLESTPSWGTFAPRGECRRAIQGDPAQHGGDNICQEDLDVDGCREGRTVDARGLGRTGR